jgi:hypothetical protein
VGRASLPEDAKAIELVDATDKAHPLRPRWCKIYYKYVTEWIECRFLKDDPNYYVK